MSDLCDVFSSSIYFLELIQKNMFSNNLPANREQCNLKGTDHMT